MKRHLSLVRSPIAGAVAALAASLLAGPAVAAPLTLSNVPLFLTTTTRPNILMLYGNSNSMDSDATGAAVGSTNANSKSEIARNAIKTLVTNYTGAVNMGLLAYQQFTSGSEPVRAQSLFNSQYDVSFDPNKYDANWTGARNGTKKKYRVANPNQPGSYLYYNVVLPFYDNPSSRNPSVCYSSTACTDTTHDFTGTRESNCATAENPPGTSNAGPWDTYDCFGSKTGTSDAAPVNRTNNANSNNGYSGYINTTRFFPTDSDLGQGITDFGKIVASQYVSQAWFSNDSPGKGYLHIPISALDTTQAAKLNKKLATSQFDVNAPTDANYPLQNAGLTPLEGTVITANNYFNGSLNDSAQGGTFSAPPNSCGKNFLVMLTDGLPSVDKNGNPSANVTTNLSNLQTEVRNLRNSNAKVETYVVGFALPYFVNPQQLTSIATAGGTDTAYYATDPTSLARAFSTIFTDIVNKTAAASAVALNSQSISANSRVYQARFSSTDWSGQLLSYQLSSAGIPITPATWDAGARLASPNANNRVILTYKPSANKGIPFRWPANAAAPGTSELDAAQVTALNTPPASTTADANGAKRLNYLRGSVTDEGTAGLQLRTRPTSKLGDIVNSAPNYVAIPSMNSSDAGYAAFRTSKLTRTPMVYVGANDGMLHGFNAETGDELLAYVPSRVYPNLTQLTSPNYSHRFYVDGTPSTRDVYYASAWHTVLVGSLGNGGRGIFALDVTDPSTFAETNAANIVKFEFNETHDADVGYVPGPVPIVKLNNGKTAAVFGNGYNSTNNGKAALFLVDVATGQLIMKLFAGTNALAPNALSAPAPVDTDGNGTVDMIYAGDLAGNMYKFDVSSSDFTQWRVAYTLFAAGQPITNAPEVGINPRGGYMVYFGTGKYLESSDITTTNQNALYGIWDNGAAVTSSDLVQQTVTSVVAIGGKNYRKVSNNAVNMATKKGWYLTLPTSGERIVVSPILHNGRVIVTTMIPSADVCSYGGTSWLMELGYLDGGMLAEPPFDTNGDGSVNSSDEKVGGEGSDAIRSQAAIQEGGGNRTNPLEVKMSNTTSGEIKTTLESGSSKASRRISWRQLK